MNSPIENKKESIFRLHSFFLRFFLNKIKSFSKSRSANGIRLPPLISIHEVETSKVVESVFIRQDEEKNNEIMNNQINPSFDISPELLRILKQNEFSANQTINKSNKGSSVKIGDTIFFKYSLENLVNASNTVITGDGIASNRIESILYDSQNGGKNAMNSFRKSLFIIENAKSYQSHFKLADAIQKNKIKNSNEDEEYEKYLNFLMIKEQEEKEDNKIEFDKLFGQPIVYGQTIQLRHVYSGCFLMLKSEELARQNGCVGMTLEEQDSINCNFKFVPTNNLRNIEDIVFYSDIVNIVNSKEENYYLHIASEITNNQSTNEIEELLSKGLEVNGSEIATNLKINCYLNYQEQKELLNQDKCLENGDIVSLFNRQTVSSLSVVSKKIEKYFINRNISISNISDKTRNQNIFTIREIDKKSLFEVSSDLKVFSEVNKQKNTDYENFSNLWEIQRKKTFDGSHLKNDEYFRFKNVATGFFLTVDTSTQCLLLSHSAHSSPNLCSYFRFFSKQFDPEDKTVPFNFGLKIRPESQPYLNICVSDVKCNNKFEVGLTNKKIDTARLIFEVRLVNPKTSKLADRISSLVPCLLQFYVFLQKFGMKCENLNVMPIYDYETALYQEKLLENEVQQLNESLENLEDFLVVDFNFEDEKAFTQRQNVLKQQQIIEILIHISKLIDQMTFQGRKKEENQNSKNIEKSPFVLAVKHLDEPLKRIFAFLYTCAKDNEECSQFLLESNEFFKTQLKYCWNEVSSLLKEATRCSSLLCREDQNGEQIMNWIKLIEPLNELKKNIYEQSLFIELISLCLADSSNRPVLVYQNKCHEELLMKKNNLQNFPKFGLFDDKPILMLNFLGNESEFLYTNHSLADLKPFKQGNTAEFLSFYLEEFSNDCNKNLVPYIDYFCSSLQFLSYLMKGRNMKSKKKIEEFNFDPNFFIIALKNPSINNKLKANLLHFYMYLYLDNEPYQVLTTYSNRCIIWSQLESFSLQSETYQMVNNIIQKSIKNPEKMTPPFYEEIRTPIFLFWDLEGYKLLGFGDKDCFEQDSTILEQKLFLFLNFLKITGIILELGYTDLKSNKTILRGISNILAPIMIRQIKQDFATAGEENIKNIIKETGLEDHHDYWIYKFFDNALSIKDKKEIRRLCEVVLLKSSEIFLTMANIRLNLQIISYLQIFKNHIIEIDYVKDKAIFEDLFKIYDLNLPLTSKNTRKSTYIKKESNLTMIQSAPAFPIQTPHLHIDSILLYSLFSSDLVNMKVRQNVLSILISHFDQRALLLHQLHQIEILDTDAEFQLYMQCENIISVNNKNISNQRLEFLIKKLINSEEILSSPSTSPSPKKDKRKEDEIIEILEIIINKFEELKYDLYLLQKFQNILRNLKYHITLVNLLDVGVNKLDLPNFLIKKTLLFFTYFVFQNSVNNDIVLNSFQLFLDIASKYKLSIAKLLIRSLETIKCTNDVSVYINTLCDFLEELYKEKISGKQILILDIFSVLRGVTLTNGKNSIIFNQKKITSRLLKINRLLTFTRTSYLDVKNKFMEKLQKDPENEKVLQKMRVHLSEILLFASLSVDFKMGVLQLQKIFVYEQIKNLLFDATTPFVYKTPYLKLLFQNYVVKIDEVNSLFGAIDLAELINQIVVNDLGVYGKYIEGIVSIADKDQNNISLRNKLISNRQYYTSDQASLSLTSRKSFMPSSIPRASSIFEPRRILLDPSEYWDYLMGGNIFDNSREGLLFFILDCLSECEHREWTQNHFDTDEILIDSLSLTKMALRKIKTSIELIAKGEEDENVSANGLVEKRKDKSFKEATFRFMTLIQDCIDRLPNKIVNKAGKAIKIEGKGPNRYRMEKNEKTQEDYGQEEVKEEEKNDEDIFLCKIRKFLLDKRLRISHLMELLDFRLTQISIKEFTVKLRKTIIWKKSHKSGGGHMKLLSNDEIYRFLHKNKIILSKGQNQTINDKLYRNKNGGNHPENSSEKMNLMSFRRILEAKMEWSNDMPDLLLNEEKDEKYEKLMENSLSIDIRLKKFIMKYFELSFNSDRNHEIQDLARDFQKNVECFVDLDDESENRKYYVNTVKRLISFLDSEGSEIFCLKFLRLIIQDVTDLIEKEEIEIEAEELLDFQKKKLVFIQNAFVSAGVIRYGLKFIRKETPLYIIYEAINLMILCLAYGNGYVQNSILEILQLETIEITGPFFNFVRFFVNSQGIESNSFQLQNHSIEDVTNEEIMKLTDDREINKDKLVIKIVKLLSAFCENCNQPFQNYLRNQHIEEKKTNFISYNLVIEAANLLSIIPNHKQAIISETLKALVEFIIGPCTENQQILCNNKKFLKFLNENIIKPELYLPPVHKKRELKDLLADHPKLSSFSNTIMLLLSMVLGNKTNSSILNIIESLDLSALLNKLLLIYTTYIQNYVVIILKEERKHLICYRSIISTAFNIFILLTILRENYPSHPSIACFNLSSFDRIRFNELRREYMKEKKEILKKQKVPAKKSAKNNQRHTITMSTAKIQPENRTLLFLMPKDEEEGRGGGGGGRGKEDEKEIWFEKNGVKDQDRKMMEDDNEKKKLGVREEKGGKMKEEGVGKRGVKEEGLDDFVRKESLRVLREKHEDYMRMKVLAKLNQKLSFFRNLTGSVEIVRDEKITKLYFQKLYCSEFKTPNIKDHLIYKANRDSNQARLEHLFYHIDSYHKQMVHRQKLSKNFILNIFTEYWRFFKDFSFLLIVLINILQLISYKKSGSDEGTLEYIIEAVTIIQLILGFIVMISCICERYPISLDTEILSQVALNKKRLKTEAGLDLFRSAFIQNSIIFFEVQTARLMKKLDNSFLRFVKILFDFENIYNLGYLIITIVAYFHPLVYCILLMDSVKRSDDLKNIIKAVTMNVGSLVKTALLGGSVLFMFSVLAYLKFADSYSKDTNGDKTPAQTQGYEKPKQNNFGESLLLTYTSTLNLGLRSGGGIGDAFDGPDIDESLYWDYWAFTLIFYIIINILFINIVFGIILDTFGELRDERKAQIHDIEDMCFICGINSYEFDTKGNGWLEHIYLEHNVYHYLDFLIYIKMKNINDCNGIEKYVKELSLKKNIDFLPILKANCLS